MGASRKKDAQIIQEAIGIGMIKVLDYGMGNTASLLKMIVKAGGRAELCASPSDLEAASAIVLPGVGAFDNGMAKLGQSGFLDVLKEKAVVQETPLLGVCLGMQLLFERSEEGNLPGLGFVKGDVTRFNFSGEIRQGGLKVPHMGWNLVKPRTYENVFSGLEREARFYFVHSYHVNCQDSADVLAVADFGYEFICAIRHNNIWGAQFHPEKSHRFGLQFFKNFLVEAERAQN